MSDSLHDPETDSLYSTLETEALPVRIIKWAFAEFTEVYAIQSDFEDRIEREFNRLMNQFRPQAETVAAE